MPASVHHVLDAEVEFAGHYHGVGFAGEGVEVGEGDGIDFVVDVEARRESRRPRNKGLGKWDGENRVREAGGLANPYHLMYFLWSFMITSMKSSTVAFENDHQFWL